ncbi:MAG: hypothetical protein N3A61_09370, partial [Ignavibacteria bacterium]|nr:hypothetical protein [Ignavibacteria bacterium]
MKNLIITIAFLIGIGYSSTFASSNASKFGITFGFFYTSLSPYGEWIEFDNGLYGWRPIHVSYGWRPYYMGRWVWTRYGWYWDSYEPFGWATYHYGRWYFD